MIFLSKALWLRIVLRTCYSYTASLRNLASFTARLVAAYALHL